MSDTSKRVSWVDSWKGMLIFLVVMGHVVGALCHYVSPAARPSQVYLYKLIYLFHMPAFFVVAGYLIECSRTFSKGDSSIRVFLCRKSKRLLVPYFFWSISSALIYILASRYMQSSIDHSTGSYYLGKIFSCYWWRPFLSILHGGGWPSGEGFRCNSVLWFLPCLFTTLLAHRFVSQKVKSIRGFILAMAICWVIGGCLRIYNFSGYPWGMSKVPYYLGFVYFGQLMQKVYYRIPLGMLCAIIGGFAFVVAWFPDLIYAEVSWTWYLLSLFLAMLACWVTMMLARYIDCSVLQVLGGASMGIMLTHKFILLLFQLKYPILASWSLLAILVADIVVSIIVAYAGYALARMIQRFIPTILGERR